MSQIEDKSENKSSPLDEIDSIELIKKFPIKPMKMVFNYKPYEETYSTLGAGVYNLYSPNLDTRDHLWDLRNLPKE